MLDEQFRHVNSYSSSRLYDCTSKRIYLLYFFFFLGMFGHLSCCVRHSEASGFIHLRSIQIWLANRNGSFHNFIRNTLESHFWKSFKNVVIFHKFLKDKRWQYYMYERSRENIFFMTQTLHFSALLFILKKSSEYP